MSSVWVAGVVLWFDYLLVLTGSHRPTVSGGQRLSGTGEAGNEGKEEKKERGGRERERERSSSLPRLGFHECLPDRLVCARDVFSLLTAVWVLVWRPQKHCSTYFCTFSLYTCCTCVCVCVCVCVCACVWA